MTGEGSGWAWPAFAPDGRTLVWSFGVGCRAVDVRTGAEGLRLDAPGWETGGPPVVSPDGTTVVRRDAFDGTVRAWDLKTGKERPGFKVAPGARVVPLVCGLAGGVAFSPDGKTLAVAGGSQRLRLLDAATGRDLLEDPGHTADVLGVSFAAGGREVVTRGADNLILAWDATTGKLLGRREVPSATLSYALAPDGGALAYALPDGTVRVRGGGGKDRKVTGVPA